MKNNLIFRVDGGKVWGISLGHIKRCLILAQELKEKYKIIFIMKNYPESVAFVRKENIRVEPISINDDTDKTMINLCEQHAPKRVILDLYANPYLDFFNYARQKKIKTVVFDIDGRFTQTADILINDSLVIKKNHYSDIDKKTRIFTGPDFFVMDKMPKVVPIRSKVKNIMLTMGGADPAGLTLKILPSILNNIFDCDINIVLGYFFKECRQVYDLAATGNRFKVHKFPANFLKILSIQDIVICAAGRTLYECACLGRPAITVPSIDHETVTSAEYAQRTGNIDIGPWNDTKSPKKLITALDRLRSEKSLRISISNKSRRIVDGCANKRILTLIH